MADLGVLVEAVPAAQSCWSSSSMLVMSTPVRYMSQLKITDTDDALNPFGTVAIFKGEGYAYENT